MLGVRMLGVGMASDPVNNPIVHSATTTKKENVMSIPTAEQVEMKKDDWIRYEQYSSDRASQLECEYLEAKALHESDAGETMRLSEASANASQAVELAKARYEYLRDLSVTAGSRRDDAFITLQACRREAGDCTAALEAHINNNQEGE
jgi:hypothetical protein